MALFSKSKNAEVPETEQAASCPDSKKIRFNFNVLSKETISAIASDTLPAGGWVPQPKIGGKLPDGTVFAGISPDTNKPMYTTPEDASLTMTSTMPRNTPPSSMLTATKTGACRRRPS
jgi:hypothetical protein